MCFLTIDNNSNALKRFCGQSSSSLRRYENEQQINDDE